MNEKLESLILVILITFVNIFLAFIISGLVIWSVGEDPWFALKTMLYGSFGYDNEIVRLILSLGHHVNLEIPINCLGIVEIQQFESNCHTLSELNV